MLAGGGVGPRAPWHLNDTKTLHGPHGSGVYTRSALPFVGNEPSEAHDRACPQEATKALLNGA
ncbi:MAG: hypothetical protein ACI8PT_000080 [Gammaproteobacteria bacterium]|jgi:hypothetical protein